MPGMREMTGAEAGLSSERQIQIVLQAIVDLGGAAQTTELYDAVNRNMPLGTVLSEQGKHTLRSLINRDAVDQGYVEKHDRDRPGWHITPQGRSYLAQIQDTLGTEAEETLPGEQVDGDLQDSAITEPFNPAAIKVAQMLMTVFQVMRKIELGEIDLRPDFQRNFVWKETRQSHLIESILLRIPLPAFYLDATNEGRWLVVDGLQRLTTLHKFYTGKLVLTNLEFLTELHGKTFQDLPRSLQRKIEDGTVLNLYIIQPETPPEVKFTIFSRVNTGGLVLTQQEIRHALFQGRSTTYLAELALLPEFLSATANSISPLRMDDRECVLRFLAFYPDRYESYRSQSFDGFLSEAMNRINKTPETELQVLREAFREAMEKAESVFSRYAFRKMYQRDGRRTQINKPLFETWAVLLQRWPSDLLVERREQIIDGFIAQMNENTNFNKAISYGTGSSSSVSRRFQTIKTLLEEVLV